MDLSAGPSSTPYGQSYRPLTGPASLEFGPSDSPHTEPLQEGSAYAPLDSTKQDTRACRTSVGPRSPVACHQAPPIHSLEQTPSGFEQPALPERSLAPGLGVETSFNLEEAQAFINRQSGKGIDIILARLDLMISRPISTFCPLNMPNTTSHSPTGSSHISSPAETLPLPVEGEPTTGEDSPSATPKMTSDDELDFDFGTPGPWGFADDNPLWPLNPPAPPLAPAPTPSSSSSSPPPAAVRIGESDQQQQQQQRSSGSGQMPCCGAAAVLMQLLPSHTSPVPPEGMVLRDDALLEGGREAARILTDMKRGSVSTLDGESMRLVNTDQVSEPLSFAAAQPSSLDAVTHPSYVQNEVKNPFSGMAQPAAAGAGSHYDKLTTTTWNNTYNCAMPPVNHASGQPPYNSSTGVQLPSKPQGLELEGSVRSDSPAVCSPQDIFSGPLGFLNPVPHLPFVPPLKNTDPFLWSIFDLYVAFTNGASLGLISDEKQRTLLRPLKSTVSHAPYCALPSLFLNRGVSGEQLLLHFWPACNADFWFQLLDLEILGADHAQIRVLKDVVTVLVERSAEVLLLHLGLSSGGRLFSMMTTNGGVGPDAVGGIEKGLHAFIAAEGEREEHRRLEMLQIVVRNVLEKPLAAGKLRTFWFERNTFVANVGKNGEEIVVVEAKDER
ncbi:MAG: hypothetical protein Q9216_002840 [Gyalolechia sp. 2 TL-2023]